MNLAQLRSAVRNRCGFNIRDSFHTDDSLNTLINEANWSLADEQDWPWVTRTETLTATPGTATLTVATDWASTIALHHTTSAGRLNPVSIDVIDEYPNDQGLPQVFTEWNSALVVAPTPDAGYTFRHRYRCTEPELTADSDTPLSPEAMHRVIVMKAAALAHARAGNVVEARVADEEYQTAVSRARRRLNRAGGPRTPRVRPGAGW